ncbi:uncharacterized protein LOC117110627 [Anneissia japonica]|uniref:uncharacterized protein LOC117110627 n=1 Tax=Anneissia japonica TaxID=1529436 RepID=UPI001425AAD9|nr:uncharacterized protein LOC117110627 [Anneissia japonica]
MEDAKRARRACKRNFVSQADSLSSALAQKMFTGYIEELDAEFKECWRNLRTAHDAVINKVEEEEDEDEEDKWLDEFRDMYKEMRRIFHEVGTKESKAKVVTTEPRMQLKKMELPKFNGDVKLYSRFKEDFQRFVKPTTHSDQLSYTLRSCLGSEPMKVVMPAEDKIEKMWKRLGDRYGNRSKLVDVGDLVKHGAVKEGEDRKLVEFIDLVEVSYRNLERAGLEKEIANSRVVGEIEKKLPDDVFKRWVRHIHDEKNKIGETEKMSSLLSFLEEERKSVEFSIESLRSCHITSQRTKPTASVHTTDVREPLLAISWCLIHDSAQHTTEDCRAYLAKAVSDRIQLVKEKRACFRCLKPGHGVFKCKKGYCGNDGCQRKYHPSNHFQQPEKPREVKQNGAVFKPGGCMLMAIAVKMGRSLTQYLIVEQQHQ